MQSASLEQSPAPDREALASLVEAIAAKADRAAFAALFKHFAPKIKGYLIKIGTDRGQAEELTQEVMLTVWRKAATFDRRQASVSTWLFTIARNRRIDAVRR
jgi:RNA polymerase sigma-70 factor (ECF subfamily)